VFARLYRLYSGVVLRWIFYVCVCMCVRKVGERSSAACLATLHPLYSRVVHRCVLCVREGERERMVRGACGVFGEIVSFV
jgi:hypothetical protein